MPHLIDPQGEVPQIFEIMMTVLNMAHRQSDAVHPILGPKGDHPNMTGGVSAVLDSWVIGKCILKTDQEPAIGALAEQIAHRRLVLGHSVQMNAAPRRSHASMGIVETANTQVGKGVRVLKLQLEKGFRRRVSI